METISVKILAVGDGVVANRCFLNTQADIELVM